MLPDEYLKAIGRITVNFEFLSFEMSFFTWAFLKVNQLQGMAITSESSFSKICDLLASLAKIEESNLDPKEIEEIENLISRASQAEQERNSIIHSIWMIDNSSKQVSRLKISSKRKHGLKSSNPDVTPEELNEIADELKNTASEFRKTCQKLKSRGKIHFPSESFPIP